jgi:hypothetical protein
MTADHDPRAREALRLIGPNAQNWVPDRSGIDHNVTIVGGGQTGSAFCFALRRAGIGKVSVIDAAEDEARARVWLNAARMNLLRTPKSLPELGIPAFSFQAWYEARHGAAAYAAIDRIPRTIWADYLSWYRRFLGIPIRYRTRLVRIGPADAHFRLHLTSRDEAGPKSPAKSFCAPVSPAMADRMCRRCCAKVCPRRCTPTPSPPSTSEHCAAGTW